MKPNLDNMSITELSKFEVATWILENEKTPSYPTRTAAITQASVKFKISYPTAFRWLSWYIKTYEK